MDPRPGIPRGPSPFHPGPRPRDHAGAPVEAKPGVAPAPPGYPVAPRLGLYAWRLPPGLIRGSPARARPRAPPAPRAVSPAWGLAPGCPACLLPSMQAAPPSPVAASPPCFPPPRPPAGCPVATSLLSTRAHIPSRSPPWLPAPAVVTVPHQEPGSPLRYRPGLPRSSGYRLPRARPSRSNPPLPAPASAGLTRAPPSCCCIHRVPLPPCSPVHTRPGLRSAPPHFLGYADAWPPLPSGPAGVPRG